MADQRHLLVLRKGVNAWNQWREKHPEILPALRDGDLHEQSLSGIDFRRTNLDGANLHNAHLSSANLALATLYRTNLSGAKLHNAWLHRTAFQETNLQKTNFYQASLLETLFLNVNLQETKNLESVFHLGPSTVGLDYHPAIQGSYFRGISPRDRGIRAPTFLPPFVGARAF